MTRSVAQLVALLEKEDSAVKPQRDQPTAGEKNPPDPAMGARPGEPGLLERVIAAFLFALGSG
jgi:hypothetical protein